MGLQQGLHRELVSHVQGQRRVCGLSVQDTVEVLLKGMFFFPFYIFASASNNLWFVCCFFSFFLVQPQASDIDGHHVPRMRVVISKALTQCGPVKFALDLPESKPKLMVVRDMCCASLFLSFLE
jgi:hypothetical protein